MPQAQSIPNILLDSCAVTLNPEQPFQYTSGLVSPIYCDNRLLISYPNYRSTIVNSFIKLLDPSNCAYDIIAGTATAGIPWAAWIAERLNKPMVYIRNRAKGHGKLNQIEGHIQSGQKVIVIEDLITTAGSVINCVNALRDANTEVTHCASIFNYQLENAQQALRKAHLNCTNLCTLDQLLTTALMNNTINNQQYAVIKEWQKAPEQWRHLSC